MTNDQRRIAELEEQNYYLQRKLRTTGDVYQMPKPSNDGNYQYAISIDAPTKKKKKATQQQRRKSSISQAKWYILFTVIALIALRIIYVNFTTEPPPKAERQRTAKVTTR
jgi:hypothetical protein